ncbi:MAG: amidohydrolase [Chloroflexi bacterium]|nr:amidohydrolase [Chloroflexota bacterium]
MKVIDLEAHFLTREYEKHLLARKDIPRADMDGDLFRVWYDYGFHIDRAPELGEALRDFGERRLGTMDAAGVDVQAISLTNPHVQCFEPAEGVAWSKTLNNVLAAAVKTRPDRFLGLACIAPQDPEAAAAELERAVTELGLRGVCVQSHARNEYLDDRKYWPIFEAAERLDVPLYLHPEVPSTAILKPYADYGAVLLHYAFAAEVAVHTLRLIHSGLFDQYPGLKIILGHMGEGLPFWISRLDTPWRRKTFKAKIARKVSDYLKTNFTITTSGMCFQPAFLCAYLALGADRMAFAVDYPMGDSQEAVAFLKSVPICDEDREKISHLNAEKLLKIQ